MPLHSNWSFSHPLPMKPVVSEQQRLQEAASAVAAGGQAQKETGTGCHCPMRAPWGPNGQEAGEGATGTSCRQRSPHSPVLGSVFFSLSPLCPRKKCSAWTSFFYTFTRASDGSTEALRATSVPGTDPGTPISTGLAEAQKLQ